MNDHLLLIAGKAATGKSMSLRNLRNPEGVMYLNTETGKKLPFKSKFQEFTITDPLQVFEAFTHAETLPDVHTIIVDSLTYLMEMYESVYVVNSANTMQSWGEYAQFFKMLMQQYVAKSTKNVIFTAHTMDVMNDKEMCLDTFVKVKGSLMNNGIESWFSTVISTKKESTAKLTKYNSDLLNVSARDERLKYKHVFQTQLTENTVGERIRGPIDMWAEADKEGDVDETFIDNDLQLVIDRLHEYYA